MKPIGACLPSIESANRQSPGNLQTAQPVNPTAMRTLWVRMAEIYGHRWTSSYGAEANPEGAAGTWAKGLAGVSAGQIAEGLRACLASAEPWPPTLPEFRAMSLGIPSLSAVKLGIKCGDMNAFARLVWQHIDGYRYKQADYKTADRLLQEAYDIAREYVMRGGELPPEPVGEIAHDEPKRPEFPETREERALRLAAKLGEDYNPETSGLPNSNPVMSVLRDAKTKAAGNE